MNKNFLFLLVPTWILIVSVGIYLHYDIKKTSYKYIPNRYVVKTGSILMKIDSEDMLNELKKNPSVLFPERLKIGRYIEKNAKGVLLANTEESFNEKFLRLEPYKKDNFSVFGFTFKKEKSFKAIGKTVECELITNAGQLVSAINSHDISEIDKKNLNIGACITPTKAVGNYSYKVFGKENFNAGSMIFVNE